MAEKMQIFETDKGITNVDPSKSPDDGFENQLPSHDDIKKQYNLTSEDFDFDENAPANCPHGYSGCADCAENGQCTVQAAQAVENKRPQEVKDAFPAEPSVE